MVSIEFSPIQQNILVNSLVWWLMMKVSCVLLGLLTVKYIVLIWRLNMLTRMDMKLQLLMDMYHKHLDIPLRNISRVYMLKDYNTRLKWRSIKKERPNIINIMPNKVFVSCLWIVYMVNTVWRRFKNRRALLKPIILNSWLRFKKVMCYLLKSLITLLTIVVKRNVISNILIYLWLFLQLKEQDSIYIKLWKIWTRLVVRYYITIQIQYMPK